MAHALEKSKLGLAARTVLIADVILMLFFWAPTIFGYVGADWFEWSALFVAIGAVPVGLVCALILYKCRNRINPWQISLIEVLGGTAIAFITIYIIMLIMR